MRSIKLTERKVRSEIKQTVKWLLVDFRRGQYDIDTKRDTLIEWQDEKCDSLWGDLVKQGRLDEYTVDDMVETAAARGVILQVAQDDAWIESDTGLWEGLQYGVLANMAYFSLRNLLYKAMEDANIDTNDEFPFMNPKLKLTKEQKQRAVHKAMKEDL